MHASRLYPLLIALLLGPLPLPAEISSTAKECVVLLHGLGRTEHSLRELEEAATEAGYVTVNIGYPSRDHPIEELAEDVIPRAIQDCRAANAYRLHFITHSMGGILVRYFLKRNDLAQLGRVVMLSPPNQGSEAADDLKDVAVYRWLNGPAGQQLTTGPDGLPAQLGPVNFPLGIITGNRHAFFDDWLSDEFPGEHDGKVSVERAKVEGMSDFLVVPHSHPFIMDADEVIAQSLFFLQHGHFDRADNEPRPFR
jgi:hypothetical protein